MKIDLSHEELTILSTVLRGFKANRLDLVLPSSDVEFIDSFLFDIDLILSS